MVTCEINAYGVRTLKLWVDGTPFQVLFVRIFFCALGRFSSFLMVPSGPDPTVKKKKKEKENF